MIGKYIVNKCPYCNNTIRPSKIEFRKWVCKKCYRIIKEEEIKNGSRNN